MKDCLREVPEYIETERLYMRTCRREDAEAVNAAVNRSREELKQWLPFAVNENKLEETAANLVQSMADFTLRKDLRYLIFRREDDAFIGSTGLHRINWDIPKFEIGYWIDTQHSKKGYMLEAISSLSAFAFDTLGARRLEIRCDPDNTNSRRIPEKLGFTLEGILRCDSLSADRSHIRDTCVFAKTIEDR